MVLTAEAVFVGGALLKQTGIQFLAAVLPGEIIAFTNTERSGVAVGTVVESSLLSKAAQAKAEDMAAKGYFSHVGPDGKEPWVWIEEAGYSYTYAGENLAVRFLDSHQVVDAWMASPSHRANIVKGQYTEIGVGVAEGMYEGQPATYVVQYFGTPRVAAVAQAAEPVSTPASVVDEEETVSAPVIPEPEVQGVATPVVTEIVPDVELPAAVESQGGVEAYLRAVFEGIMRADTSALWLIGGIAALLVVALLLAFFIHLQVQPTDMLMSGATVAAIAITLLAINAYYVRPGGVDTPLGASVATALPEGVVGDSAAFAEASF